MASHTAARSRHSSSKSKFRRSSLSLFTMSTAAVRYVGIPISAVRYVGIPISAGITALVPYVREKGVSPWLDLIIVRWAQRTWGSSSTQRPRVREYFSKSVYRPEWGVTNGNLLDTPEACQDLVDHIAPPGYFYELRHMHNDEFPRQYNVNLARQVPMGSQLRLRFEQEAKLLRKSVAQVARRDRRIQARELEIKNLEAVLEAKANTKKAAEDRSRYLTTAGLWGREAEGCFQRVQAAAGRAGGSAMPPMGHRTWAAPCRDEMRLESIEAYDPEAEAKFVAALQALKDLKYPLVDQLESLKDAPMDVYPEVRDPRNPWACKEEIVLTDAIAANISHAEKKKKCRIVCRTHGVGSAHHARSDGVPVSAPTVVP
nr:hypothetical protein [Tanacetum cinerariifolium]